MGNIRVRFAPSPTGFLHIGGIRTALYNFLFAKKHKGTFILRLEDTDQKRYTPEAEKYILESLKWLGIEPDEGIEKGGEYAPYKQSERSEIYKKHINQLLKEDKAYYAFDTEEELETIREKDNTFMYNLNYRKKLRNSISLDTKKVQELLEQNTPYVIRFKVPQQHMTVQDIIRGTIKIDTSTIDDKVLLKHDGTPTYHLANIVDDHLMKISHVIRGEEWLPSLPFHKLLYDAFGWEAPIFAHLPLILKPNGKGKLSKRDEEVLGGVPVFPILWKNQEKNEFIKGYREKGFLPDALINLLVLIGWNPGENKELFFNREQLIQEFTFEKIQKSGAKFNPEKALWINQKHIENLSDQSYLKIAENYLSTHKKMDEIKDQSKINRILLLIKDRIKTLSDLEEETNSILHSPSQHDGKLIEKIKINPEYLEEFISIAQQENLEQLETTFKTKIKNQKWPMGNVMKSIRLALLGVLKGPDLFEIIKILGIKETVNRVQHLKTKL